MSICNSSRTINNVHFSNREYEIISMVEKGLSYKQIGILMNISPRTVESHIKNIMLKVGCKSRHDICIFIEKYN